MMRMRFLACVLLLGPVSAAAAQQAMPSAAHPGSIKGTGSDPCETSYQRGAVVARSAHSPAGWRTAGFVSGLAFSVLGVAGATGAAAVAPAAPDSVPSNQSSACYRDGYQTAARARNRGTAFRSALLGALVLPVVYVVRVTTR